MILVCKAIRKQFVSTSPFPWGLNEAIHFPYFLLIVDIVSYLLVLLSLCRISSHAVFTKLQQYRTNFQPNADHDVNPEMNLFNTQHVHTDAGSQFASQEFVDLCNRNNI
jgi:hypothetical protein